MNISKRDFMEGNLLKTYVEIAKLRKPHVGCVAFEPKPIGNQCEA